MIPPLPAGISPEFLQRQHDLLVAHCLQLRQIRGQLGAVLNEMEVLVDVTRGDRELWRAERGVREVESGLAVVLAAAEQVVSHVEQLRPDLFPCPNPHGASSSPAAR